VQLLANWGFEQGAQRVRNERWQPIQYVRSHHENWGITCLHGVACTLFLPILPCRKLERNVNDPRCCFFATQETMTRLCFSHFRAMAEGADSACV
jgi:hypothetical protein